MRNSGQGPGGSPVPRVLMIAVLFLVRLEKESVVVGRKEKRIHLL